MASTFTGSPEQLSDLVLAGLQVRLQAEVLKAIRENVEPLLQTAAKEAAQDIVARVESMRYVQNNTIELRVFFNQKEV